MNFAASGLILRTGGSNHKCAIYGLTFRRSPQPPAFLRAAARGDSPLLGFVAARSPAAAAQLGVSSARHAMSWDIYIQDFPAAAKKVADIPNDFRPRSLGMRADLIAQIREVVPTADFSNPDWGLFEWDGFSIEFQMGEGEECRSITFLIRGGGNPTSLIAALLDRLQLRGIDCQAGEFFNVDAARASFGSWQRYRDQIVGEGRDAKS